MLDIKSEEILRVIGDHSTISSLAIHENVSIQMSYATVKRLLSKLISENLVQVVGRGKGARYQFGAGYNLLYPIDVINISEPSSNLKDFKTKKSPILHVDKKYIFSIL